MINKKIISFQLDDDLFLRLSRYCEKNDIGFSSAIRIILNDFFAKCI